MLTIIKRGQSTHKLNSLILAFCLTFGVSLAYAQSYPNRTVKMIVPLTTGSGADIAGRVVAKSLTETWKQPVIIENRPGAGGLIGTGVVVNSDPDGYTLLVQSASYAANPAIYKKLPYDPLKSLVDVAILGQTPYVMITAADSPYQTIRDLVIAAKSKPNEITFASAGVGYSGHDVWAHCFLYGSFRYRHWSTQRRETACLGSHQQDA